MLGFRWLAFVAGLSLATALLVAVGTAPTVAHNTASVGPTRDVATEQIRTTFVTEVRPAVTIDHISSSVGGVAVTTTSGWKFTLQSDVTVRALGVYDSSGDGLVKPHPVGIWDEAGKLLLSSTVPAKKKGRLINKFRYVDVPRVTLKAGSYVIGAFYWTPLRDGHIGGGSGNRFSSSGPIEWIEPRRIIAPALKLPTNATKLHGEPVPGSFGPNFLFTSVITPEQQKPRLGREYWMERAGKVWKLITKDVHERDGYAQRGGRKRADR